MEANAACHSGRDTGLGWQTYHVSCVQRSCHTFPSPARSPRPTRLWTGVMAAPYGSRARICWQVAAAHCLLPFPFCRSSGEGTYCVFTGTFYLERMVISGHCCSAREALPHVDAVLLPEKPAARKPKKLVVGHIQNWAHIPLIAWGRACGPEMENLSKTFAHSKLTDLCS